MTRRYTGAEARELAAKATQGEWCVGGFTHNEGVIFAAANGLTIATVPHAPNRWLLAAAPDLAASLAAVEAERDALREVVRRYLRTREAYEDIGDGVVIADYNDACAALRETAK